MPIHRLKNACPQIGTDLQIDLSNVSIGLLARSVPTYAQGPWCYEGIAVLVQILRPAAAMGLTMHDFFIFYADPFLLQYSE